MPLVQAQAFAAAVTFIDIDFPAQAMPFVPPSHPMVIALTSASVCYAFAVSPPLACIPIKPEEKLEPQSLVANVMQASFDKPV